DLGAGRLLQAADPGAVVNVVVGDDDPPHPFPHGGADDGVDVAGIVGPGVDDGHLVDTDQVGVGARAGHEARVGSDDPAHQWGEGAGYAVCHVGHAVSSGDTPGPPGSGSGLGGTSAAPGTDGSPRKRGAATGTCPMAQAAAT